MLVLQHAHIGYEHEGESEQSHDLERRLLLPDEPICLPQQPQQQLHRNVAAAVLAAHFLARWAWRSWEFSVALLLVHLYPGSLRLVAVYGLLDDLCSLALGPLAGQFVDR
jgi:iron-regulated transporter 1